MAVSFKKEVILEAIKSVLAEEKAFVKNKKGDEALVDVDPTDSSVKNDPNISSIVTTSGKKIKEDHHEDPNDESDMAKVQLANIIHYAQELIGMIPDGMQLDAWVQSKLTIAFEYVDTVKHYLEGEEYLAATQGASEEEDLQAEARKRGEKTIRKELDATKLHMMDLAKRWKSGDKSVLDQLKALTAQKKALEKELEAVVAGIGVGQELSGEVDEIVTEGVSCCGRCGRVHESAQECKKPYIGKDSPKHCKNKK